MTGRRRRRRAVTAAWIAGAALLAGLVAALAFRTWIRRAPAPDAPVVGLSIGDDLLNGVGVHQASYQAVVTAAGGRVVEFEPDGSVTPAEVLDRVDALVLTGGGDVDPALYGGRAGSAVLVDPARDAFEAGLIAGAIERDMPVLAVCRGIQVLNVARGGTVRDVRGTPVGRTHGITTRSLKAHRVTLEPGSHLDRLAGGRAELEVTSFHGQVVDAVAPGLAVVARAPDGVVEAVEVEGATFALGIQWHPEMEAVTDPVARALFERLVVEARAYRARGAGPVEEGPLSLAVAPRRSGR